MSTSPLTVAGDHLLSDLLFSPRIAFIWDSGLSAVTWLNGSARERFQRGPQDLTAALSKATVRKLTALSKRRKNARGANRRLEIQALGAPPLSCSHEPFKLADGRDGLIVSEAPDAATIADGAAGKAGEGAADTRAKHARPATVPLVPHKDRALAQALTPDEWRSFKAIGRKVRKLCREKLRAVSGGAPSGPARPTPDANPAGLPLAPRDPQGELLRALLPAFDLFLRLDAEDRILKIEGRLARIGWRKTALRGKPASDMFCSSEKDSLDRMSRKVKGQGRQTSRSDLLALCAGGLSLPCRAVFGTWPLGDAVSFLALTFLDAPPAQKGLKQPSADAFERARLAA